MLVSQNQAERLVDLVLTLSKRVAIKAHEYIGKIQIAKYRTSVNLNCGEKCYIIFL